MMTPKERWVAAVRMEPVDRLPFWPKLNGSYPIAQEPPFCDISLSALHDWIGSDKHVGIPACVREVRKSTSVEVVTESGLRRTIYKTPSGSTEVVAKFDAPSQSWHPIKLPVENLGHVKLMTEFYRDCAVELNEQALERAKAAAGEIGSDAVTKNSIGTSPLMHWVEFLAGVEMGHLLLADHTQEVEALFDAMHRTVLRKAEIICEYSPCDLVYSGENTSTTLTSPAQFRKYCFKHLQEYAAIINAAGRPHVLHMCGLLKDVLPDLAKLPVAAFEAFTSPTLGNTTFMDGRAACPDTCLIGGTNAVLWTRPADTIIAEIEDHLDQLPHHRGIVVTSAGVMPPLARPETIRKVCEWVKSYPARM